MIYNNSSITVIVLSPPTMRNDNDMKTLGDYCRKTKAVTAMLTNVPFQRILFAVSRVLIVFNIIYIYSFLATNH